jgi:ubiquinone/menaquinone biosynthesis C-methylase UbiE
MRIVLGPTLEHMYRFGMAGLGQAGLIEKILSADKGNILNVGCGPQGHHIANLVHWTTFMVAADHDLTTLSEARRDVPVGTAYWLAADAYRLPFLSNTFQHVIGLGLLAYINEPHLMLEEFARLISANGRIVLTTSSSRPRDPVLAGAHHAGLRLVLENDAACPSASGPFKRRTMFVFANSST